MNIRYKSAIIIQNKTNSWHILGTNRKSWVKFIMNCIEKTQKPLLDLNQENRLIEEIGIDYKQKKSPFLMTFLFAPSPGLEPGTP